MSVKDTDEAVPGSEDFKTLEKFAGENLGKDTKSDVIEAVPPIYMRATIYIFGAVVIASLLLAYFSKVYVIVQSQGSIIPEGQSVVVEAESSGVISDLKVALGDTVAVGQIITELRQDAADVSLTTLNDQLNIQKDNLTKAQSAMLLVNNLLKDPSMVARQPMENFSDAGPALVYIGLLRNTMQRLGQLRSKRNIDLAEQKRMMEDQIKLQKTTIKSLKNREKTNIQTIETTLQTIKLRDSELKRTVKLTESRVLTERELNAARDALLNAQNTVNEQKRTLSDTRLEINRASIEINNLKNSFQTTKRDLKNQIDEAELAFEKAISDLGSSTTSFQKVIDISEASIAEIRGKLRLQENSIQKLVIRSPVNGEITALNFNSRGQLVGKGARVAVIVPTDVRPIILVTVPNKDIAGIKEGISARVKVIAYPFRQYGTVKAKVTRVFPQPDKPAFNVRLRLKENFINVNGNAVPLEPGLSVDVDLLTERKRILELIFKKMS